MKKDPKVRFISEVATTEESLKSRKPFRVSSENQRQFVRLEITSPMWLRCLKDIFGNFSPSSRQYDIEGTILNISAGGVLVEVDQPLNEGDIVSMRFKVQDVEHLENVLGLVKRTDQGEDYCLSGIEFITRQHLQDKLSTAEIELLGQRFGDFRESVHQVLSRYLYSDKKAAAK